MRPFQVLFKARRNKRLPGSLKLPQIRHLRQRHSLLTRDVFPYRGANYAAWSDIATFQPVKKYFDWYNKRFGEKDSIVWARRFEMVQAKYLPEYKLQRILEILHDMRANQISLTARITGEALKCFDGIPEADQARAAPLRDKLMALYQEQQAAEEEKQRQKELKQQKREQREQREQMAQQASGISPSPEPQAEAPAPKPWYAVILEAPAAIAQRFKDRI